MSIKDIYAKIDSLQVWINQTENLNEEIKKRINYKFRLDWNYYSNSIEGSTLTMKETRSVMVGNIDVRGRPFKDIMEMKGHDDVISDILKIGKGELRLSEKRIKEIHQLIMYEDDVNKKQLIGIWKTIPNYIINSKKEKFEFVLPSDVNDKVHELLNKTNADIDSLGTRKKRSHPVEIALQFHIDFLGIHPFYDGNGRTARILMNLLLISFGYPPVIIKDTDKDKYNVLITDIQSYGGKQNLLFEYLAGLLERSQKMVLDAIAGKEIEDEEDLDKKLELLDWELLAVDPENEIKKLFDSDVFFEIYDSWFTELLLDLVPKVQKFNKYFIGTKHRIQIYGADASIIIQNELIDVLLPTLRNQCVQNKDRIFYHNTQIVFQTFYGSFIKGGVNSFGCVFGIEIKFDVNSYSIEIDQFEGNNELRERVAVAKKLLHQPLTTGEIKEITRQFTDSIYKHIVFYKEKNKLK